MGYLLPLVLSIFPFITSSYGEAGLWCWIKSQNSEQAWIERGWALAIYIINGASMIYTIVLYILIWNWMEAEASENEKTSIKLISLIPLVHFIALF